MRAMRSACLGTFLMFGGLMTGCANEPEGGELVKGEAQALVTGTLSDPAIVSEVEGLQVALIWLYWPEELCEIHSVDGDDLDDEEGEGRSCTGAYYGTTGVLEPDGAGFRIAQATPPPSYVRSDGEIAEAFIALIPPDTTVEELAADSSLALGVSTEHMVVYVPEELDSERIEAQMLGGNALGDGFHLVEVLPDGVGQQVEGENDTGHVITNQRGRLTPNVPIVITVGATDAPLLFL